MIDDLSNKVYPVTLDELIATVEAINACDRKLENFCIAYLPRYGNARAIALMKGVLSGSITLEPQ